MDLDYRPVKSHRFVTLPNLSVGLSNIIDDYEPRF